MKNKIVIIDDESDSTELIKDTLNEVLPGYDVYPENDPQHDAFFKIVRSQILNNITAENVSLLLTNLKELEINPVLFIIDISLTGHADNQAGLSIGRKIKELSEDNIPILFITTYTKNQIGGNLHNEDHLVYKSMIKGPNKDPISFREKVLDRIPSKYISATAQGLGNVTTVDQNPLKEDINKLDIQIRDKRLLITKKIKTEIKEFLDSPGNYIISFIITLFFYLTVLSSALFFLYFSVFHLIIHKSHLNWSALHMIELLFISPLPLLITFTFFRYYNDILKPVLFRQIINTDNEKSSSLLDINISKYLFVSILFSTILVTLIESFTESRRTADIELKNIADTTRLNSPLISHLTISDLKNNIKAISSNSNFTLLEYITCGAILILLMVYLIKLEKYIAGKKERHSN